MLAAILQGSEEQRQMVTHLFESSNDAIVNFIVKELAGGVKLETPREARNGCISFKYPRHFPSVRVQRYPPLDRESTSPGLQSCHPPVAD